MYLRNRLFWGLAGVIVLYLVGWVVPGAATLAGMGLAALLGAAGLDAWLLYRVGRGLTARREVPERFSNGDDNPVDLVVRSGYRFPAHVTLIDEVPVAFQMRDTSFELTPLPGAERTVRYTLRPTRRGSYGFGALHAYASSPLGFVERRFTTEAPRDVAVYPSFLQMRRYELLALSNRLDEVGVKRVRRLGHTMEFDHVRPYVVGDDYRTVNWKATARATELMVNAYQEERAQPVYCVLDMGRVMQMPFEGMTLLDYSINASLVLANIALLKHDRAGLVTFSHTIGTTVPAERRPGQIYAIQEALYRAETDFLESDYARLAVHLRRRLDRRSLLVLFTNFETRAALRRQLPYLRALARRHVVVAVFFENTELQALVAASDPTGRSAPKPEHVYRTTIAEKFVFEKREIVRELRQHGIRSVLTPPSQLTPDTVNLYLGLKARGTV